jgi:hypothetical protein
LSRDGASHMDKPKNTVINEKLIKDCIYIAPSATEEEKKSRDRELKVPKQQLEFYEVECLVFSFRHISQIDNLVGFDQLTKLQLDNNNITKVENLGHLVKLQWLDLSFNNISKIEGLESLTQLTDLTLYSNNITALEGMDKLLNLNCFSIGKNNLNELDEVAKYLRKFKKLRMLTLSSNPLCKHPSYESKILAHIKNLKYLDYRLVDKDKVEKSVQDQREQLMEIETEEAKAEEESKNQAEAEQTEAQMIKMNMPGLNALFDDMFRDDPEAKHMNAFIEYEPGLKDAQEKYRTRYLECLEEFKTKMGEHRQKKDAEINEFTFVMDQSKSSTDTKCKELIKAFEKKKKKVIANAGGKNDDDASNEQEWADLRGELDTLQEQLQELETDQLEAFEDVIRGFEQTYNELTEQTTETITQSFTKLREEEKAYFDDIFQVFIGLVENRHTEAPQGNLGGEASFMEDDARKQVLSILDNKEDVMKMINESHEAHEQKMYGKEEQLISNEKKMQDDIQQSSVSDERARNRSRVCEINMYVSLVNQEISSYLDQEEASYYSSYNADLR